MHIDNPKWKSAGFDIRVPSFVGGAGWHDISERGGVRAAFSSPAAQVVVFVRDVAANSYQGNGWIQVFSREIEANGEMTDTSDETFIYEGDSEEEALATIGGRKA